MPTRILRTFWHLRIQYDHSKLLRGASEALVLAADYWRYSRLILTVELGRKHRRSAADCRSDCSQLTA